MINKNPFQIQEFKGLNRGSVDSHFATKNNDMIPFSYAIDGTNGIFTKEGAYKARPGTAIRAFTNMTLFAISIPATINFQRVTTQHWKINRIGTTDYSDRWLILEYDPSANIGHLIDVNGSLRSDILSLTSMKYASVINIFGRLYISPLSDFGVPLANESIYLYESTWDGISAVPVARLAAGPKPSIGGFTVAEFANASANATAGMHLCAIAFETSSGYITPPNATWKQVTVTVNTGKSIKFSSVDLGPTGTVARHLLVSKIILNYDGIQPNWELFFGLRIPDNTTTTGEVILPDTGLVDSADYLLNEYETIPAVSNITVLHGRLMYNGSRIDKRVTLVSKVADPETINQNEDYIQIYDGIPADITNGRELRGQYYIFKESSTYVTSDNGGPPNTWNVNIIDSGLGAAPFGIAEVMVNPGSLVLENLLIANLSGVYSFNGVFANNPVGRNIQSVFDQIISRSDSKYSRIAIDPVKRIGYLLVGKPLEVRNATEGGCTIYIADYYNGIDINSVKWMKWEPWASMAISSNPI